ncbi:CAP domain-containing protein [Actinotalea sp. M2MS4P-6]|uniref:CAP domain-containing protein n=1 Tax=Actinotalea sp. M2MS4P-6 TaxID=2983762 RepID=UPI0021E4C08D|nr:CAP domain-containing protein [Actinotalea sp. M2MS4P-6]MCV2395205.1 CAP domain-containing protein [Actinotalea sp. M2MS4P-6]
MIAIRTRDVRRTDLPGRDAGASRRHCAERRTGRVATVAVPSAAVVAAVLAAVLAGRSVGGAGTDVAAAPSARPAVTSPAAWTYSPDPAASPSAEPSSTPGGPSPTAEPSVPATASPSGTRSPGADGSAPATSAPPTSAAVTTAPPPVAAPPATSAPPVTTAPADPADTATVEARLFDLLNQARADAGLGALARKGAVDSVARAWSTHLADGGLALAHNPDYASQIPSGWSSAGENVAWINDNGTLSAAEVAQRMHDAWMASDGHRANILGAYTTVGIGVAHDPAHGWYLTQNFATY